MSIIYIYNLPNFFVEIPKTVDKFGQIGQL